MMCAVGVERRGVWAPRTLPLDCLAVSEARDGAAAGAAKVSP